MATVSKSKQNYSAMYKSTTRWATNRKLKLTRLLKQQPNNEQIKDALANIKYLFRLSSEISEESLKIVDWLL